MHRKLRKCPCPACKGKGTEYVDWADDYAPCSECDGAKVVSYRRHRFLARFQRKQVKDQAIKMALSHQNKQPVGYRIQCEHVTYNDWDVVCNRRFEDVRIVLRKDYALKIAVLLNNEYNLQGGDGSPYRVVSPRNKVVTENGEHGEAFSEQQYSMPWEH